MRDIVNLRIRQCFGADYGTPGASDAPGVPAAGALNQSLTRHPRGRPISPLAFEGGDWKGV
jgi:hypothetical protein